MPFKKGMKRLPGAGMKKGQVTERIRAWDQLGELVTGAMTERVIEYMDTLPPEKMFTSYLLILEYFKPKLNRSEIKAEIGELKDNRKKVWDEIQQEPDIPGSTAEAE